MEGEMTKDCPVLKDEAKCIEKAKQEYQICSTCTLADCYSSSISCKLRTARADRNLNRVKAQQMRESGKSISEIAHELGIAKKTAYNYLSERK